MIKRDFTRDSYSTLLVELRNAGYAFLTFEDFICCENLSEKIIILRHDIDRSPQNALLMAKLECEFELRASYYFRVTKGHFDENVISSIVALGHEIGYHYEDLSLSQGNYELAIKNFELNLRKLREFYSVKTICMHGSPFSKWDNKLMWQKYNYRDFELIGEPYFDIDFNEVAYLTDTGRKWNASADNVRDTVWGSEIAPVESPSGCSSRSNSTGQGGQRSEVEDVRFRKTMNIIDAVKRGMFPDKAMINVHPQRWNNDLLAWMMELVMQNIKNCFKKVIKKFR